MGGIRPGYGKSTKFCSLKACYLEAYTHSPLLPCPHPYSPLLQLKSQREQNKIPASPAADPSAPGEINKCWPWALQWWEDTVFSQPAGTATRGPSRCHPWGETFCHPAFLEKRGKDLLRCGSFMLTKVATVYRYLNWWARCTLGLYLTRCPG